MKITVFTPTYNRATQLYKLYTSLCSQTSKDFEWLIVDDGSKDNTENVVKDFIVEGKINIRYFKQANGGKHRAINFGVQEAKGDLFFIVDSDDYLADNAIERVRFFYNQIKENPLFAGVSGMRYTPKGLRIGGNAKFSVIDASAMDIRYKYHVKGDMAEVYRTEVIRQYTFPEFDNEKFCTEALVWNRIAQKYKLRYFNEGIYVCDYLPDGLTAHMTKLRMDNPQATLLFYSELNKQADNYLIRCKAAINFWRFSYNSGVNLKSKVKQIGLCNIIFKPFGLFIHKYDMKNR